MNNQADPRMTPSSQPPSSQPPSSHRAHDLGAEEAGVAQWFAQLERVEAPAGLRMRILEAHAAGAHKQPAGRLLRVPFGGWGLASAALLLLALGAAAVLELSDPVAPVPPAGAKAARAADDLLISEDATLALFHGVEMFDEVGMAPGDVIADWGR